MSKRINESLSKEFRLGQIGVSNKELIMTIIAYRNAIDIDVQFEDGTIVESKTYNSFLNGTIANLNYRIGETNINNKGLKMTIIAYRNANDIDVQFEDGTIVENKQYSNFLKGAIAYPMEDRIGETNINNQDLIMTIMAYRGCMDIDIQFEDGTIVKNREYGSFLKGTIANPNVLSDGISIPEKFMWNMLKELNIEFKTQLNKRDFEWCQNYKYDFYIPSLNMVVETHGKQHYKESIWGSSRTLEEEQLNDRLKKELALNNNIKNYVVVDCRKSELDWLKESVIKELGNYFDLSNINWGLVWNNSLKNLVYEVKRLVEEGKTNEQIVEILDISEITIMRYKKQLGIKTTHEIKQENLLRTKELVQQGKSTKEIAVILGVSEVTINNYKRELKEKGLI